MLAHSMTNIQKYPEKDKNGMTEQQLLLGLVEMYKAQIAVAQAMSYAISQFNKADDEFAWYALFSWCRYRDIREKQWAKFKDDYFDAMNLKEGIGYDY